MTGYVIFYIPRFRGGALHALGFADGTHGATTNGLQ